MIKAQEVLKQMKRLIIFFLIAIMSVLLISCTNEKEKTKPDPESPNPEQVTFTYEDQEFTIVNYFDETLDYIEKAKEKPKKQEEVYNEKVIDPIRLDVFGERRGLWLTDYYKAPINLDELSTYVDTLKQKETKLNNWIKEAFKDSVDTLPGGDKTIYLIPSNPEYETMMSGVNFVSGMVPNMDSIILEIHPSFKKKDLKYTVAHEYHHTVLFENKGGNHDRTLLEDIMIEGKADTFAQLVYPKVEAHWTEPLPTKFEEKAWTILKNNMESYDSRIKNEFFYGNLGKGIPKWSNYKLSNKIMKGFLNENPNMSIEKWTNMPADKILSESGYGEKAVAHN